MSTDCTEPDFEGTRLAEILGARKRLEAALDASIDRCARCKVCDTQIGAAMTVLGPLLERAERAEAKLAAIAAHCRARMNGPGRSGISLSAATLILGIAEGSDEEERTPSPEGRAVADAERIEAAAGVLERRYPAARPEQLDATIGELHAIARAWRRRAGEASRA